MRHRHCIDHHMRIDDCDLERIAAQSGYPMHAAVRDIVTPVAACADHGAIRSTVATSTSSCMRMLDFCGCHGAGIQRAGAGRGG